MPKISLPLQELWAKRSRLLSCLVVVLFNCFLWCLSPIYAYIRIRLGNLRNSMLPSGYFGIITTICRYARYGTRIRRSVLLTALVLSATLWFTPTIVRAQTSFSFGASGDYGYNSNTLATFSQMGSTTPALSFALALGDLSYNHASAQTWCNSFRQQISNQAVEVVTGNHDSGETYGSDPSTSDNLNFFDSPSPLSTPSQHYCPFTLPGATPITGLEGMEYYFDYPSTNPLMRFISISAGIQWNTPVVNGTTLVGNTYTISKGSQWTYSPTEDCAASGLPAGCHYAWTKNAIDGARSTGIPSVVLMMHKNCLTTGSSHLDCESGVDITNLAISEKVDLYITGHEHNYERSKQLSFNGSTCPANPGIQLGTYNSNCVVGSTNPFIKGAGTIILTIGTGGDSHYSCGTSSTSSNGYIPQYFMQCSSASFGFVKFDVTGTSLAAFFVASTGSYSDSFNIADFSVSASPSSLSIPQGGSVDTAITVSSLNLFSGTVTLSAGLSPQNSHFSVCFNGSGCASTASTSVVVPSGGSASATLTVNAGCYAVPGSYNLQVNGTFSPSILHSILIPLTVTSFTCSVGSVGAGTLITLADRTNVPVQNLKVGMRLLSYNMTTHQYVNTTITRFVTVVTYNQMVISTSTGKPLIVDQNPAQKVYAQLLDGLVTLAPVTDLQVGYRLFQPLSQTWVSITNIQYQNGGNHIMYDIYNTAPGNYIANGYLDPLKDGPG